MTRIPLPRTRRELTPTWLADYDAHPVAPYPQGVDRCASAGQLHFAFVFL